MGKKKIKVTRLLLILIIGIVAIGIYLIAKNNNQIQIAKAKQESALALTETKTTEDGFKYEITNEGTAAICGYTGERTQITIPSIIEGYSVTSIEQSAFENCSLLTSIVIPNSIKRIDENAFKNCYSLTSIEIPNSVEYIGSCAFELCSEISSIIVDKENKVYDSRENCNAIIMTEQNVLIVGCMNTIIPTSVTVIGPYAFRGNASLISIEIPSNVEFIGEGAFESCVSLRSIVIPNSVKDHINRDTFRNCLSLTSIEIPSSVWDIGYGAFQDCSSLTSIVFPDGLNMICGHAFEGCSSLTSIVFPDSIHSFGGNAFADCSSLTNIELPNKVLYFDYGDFKGCTSLTNVVMPEGYGYFYGGIFSECSALESVVIPRNVEEVPITSFSDCDSLTSIVVDKENKVYDSRENCNAIIETENNKLIVGCKNTIIPSSITSIGAYSFFSCSSLTSIVIPNSVTNIESGAFKFCDSLTIYAYSEESEAVSYAKTNNIPYKIIKEGEEPVKITEAKVGNKDILKGITINLQGTTVEELKYDSYFANKTVKFLNESGKELLNTDKIGTGTRVQITDTLGNVIEKTILIYGDTNGDGLINAIDALSVVKNKLGVVKFTDEVFIEAGRILTTSGTPSAKDALAIVKHKNGTYTINQSK